MKKMIIIITTLLFVLGTMGCYSNKEKNTNYLLCNDTSMGNMAEIEAGFFYLCDNILYYADKEDMTKWVPVCNKPDCGHNTKKCNAYIYYDIAQNNKKLYYVSETDSMSYSDIGIFEVSMDGSASKIVMEIPLGVEGSFIGLMSSNSLIVCYSYLREDGLYERKIARVEENGTLFHMYSRTMEEQEDHLIISSCKYFVRGDEGIISSELTQADSSLPYEKTQNILWRMDGDKPEYVKLPEEVSIGWSYLSDEYIIDYGEYGDVKGFYKFDLKSGEKTLVAESQIEDGWGYMMTEDCMVECNRYLNYASEDPQLKIYYNEKWIDVPLPDVVTKLENSSFAPVSIASDRIFFMQDQNDYGYGCRLYYVMLEEENPELMYCTTFGEDSYFELPKEESTESSNSEWKALDIVVLENDEYFIQVTGVGIDQEYKEKGQNVYKITMYCENKTSDEDYHFVLQDAAINGVSSFLSAGFELKAGEQKEHVIYINESHSDTYRFDEYTDFAFLVYESSNKENQKVVHVYPQGEENVISYKRESEPSDKVFIDNEYVTVTIVGYESNNLKNDTVKLFIENKSDTNISWKREDFPAINGSTVVRYVINEEGGKTDLIPSGMKKIILPKTCAYATIELPSRLLEENKVTAIQNFDVSLKFWYGETWDNELINDTFTITP